MLKKIPHTYAIVFYIILIAAVLTWIVPGGEYVETTKLVGDEEISTVEFQRTESQPQSWQVFAALYKGFYFDDRRCFLDYELQQSYRRWDIRLYSLYEQA